MVEEEVELEEVEERVGCGEVMAYYMYSFCLLFFPRSSQGMWSATADR